MPALSPALLLALDLACQPDQREVPVRVELEAAATAADLEALRPALAALPRNAQPERPDVLIIVLDTFRADRLAAYGGDPALAPRLNAWIEQGRAFPQARSNGTWTLPAHGSLFTGLYPIEHGARGSPPEARTKAYPLRPDVPTLAERLGQNGYRTVGIAANTAFLDPVWGLSRGFDLWLCTEQEEGLDLGYMQADRVVGLAEEVLRSTPEEQPLLLFLNFMDTHRPWVPREGYTTHAEQIDPEVLPGAGVWREEPSRWGKVRREVLSGQRPPSEEEIRSWEESYNAEVRWLDEQVGGLLERLDALGHGAPDYTILVSDHGEFLGEHRLVEHGKDLYDEVLRVPLVLRGPGVEPGLDPRPATLRDIPDWLLGQLGLPLLTEMPLFPPLQVSELYWARHLDRSTPAMARRFDRVKRAFVSGRHKLILTEGGPAEAYDLVSDPGEARSIVSALWVRELRVQAEQWSAEHALREGVEVQLNEAQEQRLRALGYVE